MSFKGEPSVQSSENVPASNRLNDFLEKYLMALEETGGTKIDIAAAFKPYPDLDLHEHNDKDMLEYEKQSWLELGATEPDMEKKISFFSEHLKN